MQDEEEDAEEEEEEDQQEDHNEEDEGGGLETCDFVVTARFQKKTGCIKVIQCHLDHSCGIMLEGATSGATLQGQWVTGHVNALLNDVPDASPAALRSHMVRRFGVTPSYHMAWRAACAIRKSLNSDEVIAFQLVQPLFSKLEQVMPGTVAVLERDLECRLLRTFVMLAPLMDAILHCKPILSFDACALKGTYKGILMAATMMDGAGQILPLAWGTAQIENGENWMWFAEKLRHGLPTRQQEIAFTVFSDREKGIESALERHFPESYHFYCMKHIEKNILLAYKYRNSRVLWKAAKATQRRHFEAAMSVIQQQNMDVFLYLSNIPVEKWATSHAPHPKWKHVTSNASESLNSWMKDVRDISHLGLHVGMVQKCTLLLYERRGMYAAVNTQFPRATTIELEGIRTHGRTLHVIRSTDTLFTVNDYAVDTSGLVTTCQCGETKQTGMPCIHMPS